MFKQLVSLSILGATLLTNLQLTQAEQNDQLLKVSNDNSSVDIYLDTQSIHDNDFDLYQEYGHGLVKIGIRVNCAYKQAYETTYVLYDENHNVVDKRNNTDKIEITEGSAIGNAFKYVCDRHY